MTATVHFIYETINLINGKKYYGKRTSRNLERDNYLGSGELLLKAIEKYGRDNFSRKILCFTESKELNAELEELLIDDALVKNPMTYNIAMGGQGGVGVASCRTPEHFAAAAAKKRGRTKENDAGVARAAAKQSAYMQNGGIEIMVSKRKGRTKETCGGCKAQSEKISGDNNPSVRPESRARQSACMTGAKNPAFGKFGENATNSKLSNLERLDIIQLHESGMRRKEIYQKYQHKVSAGTIDNTIQKKEMLKIKIAEAQQTPAT